MYLHVNNHQLLVVFTIVLHLLLHTDFLCTLADINGTEGKECTVYYDFKVCNIHCNPETTHRLTVFVMFTIRIWLVAKVVTSQNLMLAKLVKDLNQSTESNCNIGNL